MKRSRIITGSLALGAVLAPAPMHGHSPAAHAAADGCSLTQSVVLAAGESLEDVAAPDPTDAWAVGSRGDSERSLVKRWNGSAWETVKTPDVGALNAVSANSTTNVWAIGQRGALRWQGATWEHIRVPKTDLHGFEHLVAVANESVWAATSPDGSQRPMLAHWDRNGWHVRRGGQGDFYYGISASSGHDVWVVGSDTVDRPFLLHFNGHRWRRTHPPYHGQGSPFFIAIAAPAPRDLWVAGYADLSGTRRIAIIEHWDGAHWFASQRVARPGGITNVEVDTIDALPGGIASAGGNGFDGGRQVGFAIHYAGAGWAPFTPVPLKVLTSAVAVGAEGTTWAVGTMPTGPDEKDYIERFDCAGVSA